MTYPFIIIDKFIFSKLLIFITGSVAKCILLAIFFSFNQRIDSVLINLEKNANWLDGGDLMSSSVIDPVLLIHMKLGYPIQ